LKREGKNGDVLRVIAKRRSAEFDKRPQRSSGVLWKGMIKTIIHAAGILAAVVFVAQDYPTLKSLQLSRMCV